MLQEFKNMLLVFVIVLKRYDRSDVVTYRKYIERNTAAKNTCGSNWEQASLLNKINMWQVGLINGPNKNIDKAGKRQSYIQVKETKFYFNGSVSVAIVRLICQYNSYSLY